MRFASSACVLATVVLFYASAVRAAHIGKFVENPDWRILLTDYGYSDGLLDKRPGFVNREYLSGEWASAILYDQMQQIHGIPEAMWFENSDFAPGGPAGSGVNDFEAPDWPTNSTFTPVGPGITVTLNGNGPGLDTGTSTITNGAVTIRQDFTMIDTTTGIDQGFEPAVTGSTPESIISNRFIMRHAFEITNDSVNQLTNIRLFQFLHGLFSETAVYDDRLYPGIPTAFDDYRFDVTLRGDDPLSPIFVHDDIVSFHSIVEPTAWEVGPYDRQGPFDGTGKPLAEIHIDVEMDALDSTRDLFVGPPVFLGLEGIASGSQRFSLGDLQPGQSVSFDVLLSIATFTTFRIPEPSTSCLSILGLLGFAGMTSRRRTRRASAV